MTKKQKRSRPEPSVVHFELSDEELENVSGAMLSTTSPSTSVQFVRAIDPPSVMGPFVTWAST